MKRLVLLALACSLAACRGSVSEDPPIHIIQDMYIQPKYVPQGESQFFADGRAMRPQVPGTVAAASPEDRYPGQLKADDAFYRGKGPDGQFLAQMPLAKVEKALHVDSLEKVMRRGQARYNIYCTPCHDATGSANGLAVQHGFPKPVLLYQDSVDALSDGFIFNYVSNGGGANMPAYGHQIPEADRWAIVAWVRVLQRSQHATLADVPSEERGHIEPQESP